MRKKTSCLIILCMLASLLGGCGKSQMVKNAEEAIKAIHYVTLDSREAIESAEKAYNHLTDAEKEKVENRVTLFEAREKYDQLYAEDQHIKTIVGDYRIAEITYASVNEDLVVPGYKMAYQRGEILEDGTMALYMTVLEGEDTSRPFFAGKWEYAGEVDGTLGYTVREYGSTWGMLLTQIEGRSYLYIYPIEDTISEITIKSIVLLKK